MGKPIKERETGGSLRSSVRLPAIALAVAATVVIVVATVAVIGNRRGQTCTVAGGDEYAGPTADEAFEV